MLSFCLILSHFVWMCLSNSGAQTNCLSTKKGKKQKYFNETHILCPKNLKLECRSNKYFINRDYGTKRTRTHKIECIHQSENNLYKKKRNVLSSLKMLSNVNIYKIRCHIVFSLWYHPDANEHTKASTYTHTN